jgi:hypothetical protein
MIHTSITRHEYHVFFMSSHDPLCLLLHPLFLFIGNVLLRIICVEPVQHVCRPTFSYLQVEFEVILNTALVQVMVAQSFSVSVVVCHWVLFKVQHRCIVTN